MRVLVLTNLYPTPYQPTRAAFNRQKLRLLGARHAVRVIAPIAWTDELRARRKGQGARVRVRESDGIVVSHPRFYFPPGVLRGAHGRWFRWSVGWEFRKTVEEFRPDVVYAPWVYPDGWAAGRLAHATGLPVVLHALGSDVLLLDKYPAKRRRTAEALREADGVITVSADLARHAVALGADATKLRVLYDGVDKRLFCPGPRPDAPGPPALLFVGNLVPVKAVGVLLDACALLHRDGFAFGLSVVGGGPLRAALEAQAARLGIAEHVRFVGTVPHAELPVWFRNAHAFVLPSHSEGVPNVLLEASACGVPWVATSVGGIPEIAALGRSVLVPPGSPPALAGAIRAILTTPPAAPPTGPRSVEDAVAELEDFLQVTIRHWSERGGRA